MFLALLLVTALHDNAISSSAITHQPDGRLTIELAFEARTIEEFQPLDANGDGRLEASELAGQQAFLEDYFNARFTFTVGTVDQAESAPLPLALTALTIDAAEGAPPAALDKTWLLATLATDRVDTSKGYLWMANDLFLVTSPDHRHYARFVRQGTQRPFDFTFSAANPLWVAPFGALPGEAHSGQQSLGVWVRIGVEHILGGLDHLCFLIGLVVATRSWRSLAATITAFTLAHSVTLGLAAMGYIPAGGVWVEALIGASIAWVGLANLVRPLPRSTWREAGGFGLIHGLGFAGALADTLAKTSAGGLPLRALFGFNVGVELGQLFVASVAIIALAILERAVRRKPTEPSRKGPVVIGASCLLVAAGTFWTLSRLFAASA
jgi:hypothetical protein